MLDSEKPNPLLTTLDIMHTLMSAQPLHYQRAGNRVLVSCAVSGGDLPLMWVDGGVWDSIQSGKITEYSIAVAGIRCNIVGRLQGVPEKQGQAG